MNAKECADTDMKRTIVVGSRQAFHEWHTMTGRDPKNFINVPDEKSATGYKPSETIEELLIHLYDAKLEAVEMLLRHGFKNRI